MTLPALDFAPLAGDVAGAVARVPAAPGVGEILGPEGRSLVLAAASNLRQWAASRLGLGKPVPAGRRPSETRTLVYRGQRVVPHRRRSFGWLATVSHWDVEHQEVQIDFERDRVQDIHARIRRSRLTEQPPE